MFHLNLLRIVAFDASVRQSTPDTNHRTRPRYDDGDVVTLANMSNSSVAVIAVKVEKTGRLCRSSGFFLFYGS